MIRYTVITLFPELLEPWRNEGLLGRASTNGLLQIDIRDLREYGLGRHRQVDDTPYGGGAGMVIRVDVAVAALEAALPADEVILLSPAGQTFTQSLAFELAQKSHLVLLSGRYEGFDARVESFVTREISLGDYVLMGGEVAALALIEATARLVPGVIGDPESYRQDSFASGMLDYSHYTRPAEFRGLAVPEVLKAGNHAEIERFRQQDARRRTELRRPDLLD